MASELEKLEQLKERASWCEDGSDKEYVYYEAYLASKPSYTRDYETGEVIYTGEGMGW